MTSCLVAQAGLSFNLTPLIYFAVSCGMGVCGTSLGVLGVMSPVSQPERRNEVIWVAGAGILLWIGCIAIWQADSLGMATGWRLWIPVLGASPNVWAFVRVWRGAGAR